MLLMQLSHHQFVERTFADKGDPTVACASVRSQGSAIATGTVHPAYRLHKGQLNRRRG
jgi:hypothetical protein